MASTGERTWATPTTSGWRLSVRVQPGAKRDEVVGEHGNALKVRLRARAVDGKANEALIAFLADRLSVSRSAVRLIRGERNRSKVVEISMPCDPTVLLADLSP